MISASIVLYKTSKKDLDAVLGSVFSSGISIKLYIVDNSPTDVLKQYFTNKDIEYIKSENNGYGSGHNICIRKSLKEGYKYHIVLNPDIRFTSEVISTLKEVMDRDSDIGCVMPKIVGDDGELQYLCKLYPNPIHLFARRFCLRLFMNLNSKYEMRFMDYSKSFEVPIISGCFMFIRTEVLAQAGLFDERFFMYLEDFDLSRRIGAVSKNYYYPDVTVTHSHAKESYKNLKMTIVHIRSTIRYFNKWGWFFDSERKNINRKFTKGMVLN